MTEERFYFLAIRIYYVFYQARVFFFTYLLVYDGVIWRVYVLGICFHNQFSIYVLYLAQFESYLCNIRLKIRYFFAVV